MQGGTQEDIRLIEDLPLPDGQWDIPLGEERTFETLIDDFLAQTETGVKAADAMATEAIEAPYFYGMALDIKDVSGDRARESLKQIRATMRLALELEEYITSRDDDIRWTQRTIKAFHPRSALGDVPAYWKELETAMKRKARKAYGSDIVASIVLGAAEATDTSEPSEYYVLTLPDLALSECGYRQWVLDSIESERRPAAGASGYMTGWTVAKYRVSDIQGHLLWQQLTGITETQLEGMPRSRAIEIPFCYLGTFNRTADGRKRAATAALDSLTSLHLSGIRTVTANGGHLRMRPESGISALWYALARSWQNHRIGTCAACGAPFISRERGKPKRYCSKACRNWAGKHPGQTRAPR